MSISGAFFYEDAVYGIFPGDRFEPEHIHDLLSELWRASHGELDGGLHRARLEPGPAGVRFGQLPRAGEDGVVSVPRLGRVHHEGRPPAGGSGRSRRWRRSSWIATTTSSRARPTPRRAARSGMSAAPTPLSTGRSRARSRRSCSPASTTSGPAGHGTSDPADAAQLDLRRVPGGTAHPARELQPDERLRPRDRGALPRQPGEAPRYELRGGAAAVRLHAP